MKTNKLWLTGLCVMAFSMYAVSAAFAGPAPGSGIVNSKHDMRSYAGANGGIVDPQGRVCAYCHTPHHALDDAAADYLPLWSHELTQQTFTEYSSPTLDATITDPVMGPSRLCMSCHDGVVAIDAYYGQPGTTTLVEGDAFGEIGVGMHGDLSNDHPIGFVYTDVQASSGNGVDSAEIRNADETITDVTAGISTVSEVLWNGDKMTCMGCHDVHNGSKTVENYFLYGPQQDSQFCRICHLK